MQLVRLRGGYLKDQRENINVQRRCLWFNRVMKCSFTVYCLFLFIVLFHRRFPTPDDLRSITYWERIHSNFNLKPFDSISYYVQLLSDESGHFRREAFINLSANIFAFIPMGFFLPVLWAKMRKFAYCVFTGTCIILSVEILQLFSLLGSFDIDDYILNILGVGLGFLLYLICNHLWHWLFTCKSNC